MQLINLNYDSDGYFLDDTLKYLSNHILSQATLVNSNQIKFYDESSIKQFTYDIPQPYSDGVDPTGDLNAQKYEEFQKAVTYELNKCLGSSAHEDVSEDHVIITTDFESLEVHFNDSTLTFIYHFIGPQ